MQKLPPVEEARSVMTESQGWSVWKWLTEKKRVRVIADRATEALAKAREEAWLNWSEDLDKAYKEAEAETDPDEGPAAKRKYEKVRREACDIDPKIKAVVKRVLQADDEAARATQDAEDMFADAERRMSTGMARDAAKKALESYDLREKAIRRAEAASRDGAAHA